MVYVVDDQYYMVIGCVQCVCESMCGVGCGCIGYFFECCGQVLVCDLCDGGLQFVEVYCFLWQCELDYVCYWIVFYFVCLLVEEVCFVCFGWCVDEGQCLWLV